jgi:hypothetical protein
MPVFERVDVSVAIAAVDGSGVPTSMTEREHIVIGPAGGNDREEGYVWSWQVCWEGERRSGACRTVAQAECEAASVLRLLTERS